MAIIRITPTHSINPDEISHIYVSSYSSGSTIKITLKNGSLISISDRECNVWDVERKLIDAANSN